jgi:hypothetical protein
LDWGGLQAFDNDALLERIVELIELKIEGMHVVQEPEVKPKP